MENPGLGPAPLKRLLSLDVLRGVTIAFMIMVNNNGGAGAWAQMHHAAWNGLTATDLVFPTFLVCGGRVDRVCDRGAAAARRLAHGNWPGTPCAAHAFCLSSESWSTAFPTFISQHMRIYGVLQRIAICYLIVALLYLWDRRVMDQGLRCWSCALVGYWVLVRWVPVPGAGMPGRDIPFLDKDQNIVAWLDRHSDARPSLRRFGPLHNMRDPEGLLSDIPALGHGAAGSACGAVAARAENGRRRQSAGFGRGRGGLPGSGLSLVDLVPAEQEDVDQLVCAGGSGMVAASVRAHLLGGGAARLGQEGWSKGLAWPWLVFGSNAIVAYMMSESFCPACWT